MTPVTPVTPVTVVVPTRDRPDRVATLLSDLAACLDPADEVVVVDNGRLPLGPVAPARVLRVAAPGASRARNAGWRAARHPVVVLLDDDVRLPPGWRAALAPVAARVAAGELGLVCGAVGLSAADAGVERPVAVTPDRPPGPLDPRDVVGVTAHLVVARAALEAVGGLDERLGPGTALRAAEDLDLVDRLLARGVAGRFEPGLRVTHDQWRDRRALLRLDLGYSRGAAARAWLRRDRRLLRKALWDNGFGTVPGDVRRGYRFGVLTGLARGLGAISGCLLAPVLLRGEWAP